MSLRDLHVFVDTLHQHGELRRLPALYAGIPLMDVIHSNGDSVTLFEAGEGSAFSLVTGLFATEARTALALGVSDLDQLRVRVGRLLNFASGGDGLMSSMGDLMDVFKSVAFPVPPPKNPPVRQVIQRDSVDLTHIPFPLIHAQDSHRSLTGAIILWRDPFTGEQRIISGRVALYDSRTLMVSCPELVEYEFDVSTHIPMTVVLGGSPAMLWSAGVPLPSRLDRFFISSWLQGKPTAMILGLLHDLPVPAHAECVIEGWVEPNASSKSATFYESSCHLYHGDMMVMQVESMSYREHALLPVIMPCGGDHQWMLKAGERLFLPLLQLIHDGVRDAALVSGVTIVSVYPNCSKITLFSTLWGLLPGNRIVIIVDEVTDPHDSKRIMQRVLEQADYVYKWVNSVGIDARSMSAAPRSIPRFFEEPTHKHHAYWLKRLIADED